MVGKRESHAHRCADCREMYVCNDATCHGTKRGVCDDCKRTQGQQELELEVSK